MEHTNLGTHPPGESKRTLVSNTSTIRSLMFARLIRTNIRRITIAVFLVLILISTLAGMIYASLWNQWKELNMLTNMFSTFYGFMVSNALNVIASLCGLATLFGKDDEEYLDYLHATAVYMLFIASFLMNLIYPTAALMPLDVDSSGRRVPLTPVKRCPTLIVETSSMTYVPECIHSDEILVAVCLMYPLLFLELFAVILYGYLRRNHVYECKEKDDLTLMDLNDTLGEIPHTIHNHITVTRPRDQLIPTAEVATIVPTVPVTIITTSSGERHRYQWGPRSRPRTHNPNRISSSSSNNIWAQLKSSSKETEMWNTNAGGSGVGLKSTSSNTKQLPLVPVHSDPGASDKKNRGGLGSNPEVRSQQ